MVEGEQDIIGGNGQVLVACNEESYIRRQAMMMVQFYMNRHSRAIFPHPPSFPKRPAALPQEKLSPTC